MKLDPLREITYHRVVAKYIKEYQTPQHRMELRKDLRNLDYHIVKRWSEMFKDYEGH